MSAIYRKELRIYFCGMLGWLVAAILLLFAGLFTAVFHVGGSILPCIAAHILVNASSIFAVEPGLGGRVVMALVQSVVAVVCGVWILRCGRAEELKRK